MNFLRSVPKRSNMIQPDVGYLSILGALSGDGVAEVRRPGDGAPVALNARATAQAV